MEPILGNIGRLFGYPLTVVLRWRARGRLLASLSSLFAAALLWPCQPALAQFKQDGNMLVSRCDGLGGGYTVALSGDGTTAIVGVWLDSNSAGAAWVFTRSSGVWSQQGPKLVGSGAIGLAGFGASVALSGDGNTAIVGGLNDNNGVGAAWVFTRSNGVWTQQAKLAGNDAVGNTHQGISVALSGDGNTAIVGGPQDNNGAGAVWGFTRSGGQWTQQGGHLGGSGADGKARQASSFAL